MRPPLLLVFASSLLATAAAGFTLPEYVLHWGGYGTLPGQFNDPQDLAVGPDGTVFVVDSRNLRVQSFSANGDYLTHWGPGGGQGFFDFPTGIAVDGERYVWVADSGRLQPAVLRFGPNGKYAGLVYLDTYRLAIDGRKHVYGTDGSKVTVLTRDGFLLRSWTIPGVTSGLLDVALLPDERLCVTNVVNDNLVVMGLDGAAQQTWNVDGALRSPTSVVADARAVYVADSGNNRVVVLSLDGAFVQAFDIVLPNGARQVPRALALGPGGTLYILTPERIVKYAWSTAVEPLPWSAVKSKFR